MSEQISRDAFDQLSARERDEAIARGVQLYDGKEPPRARTPEKPVYSISRRLYDSLSVGQERALNEKYAVQIIE